MANVDDSTCQCGSKIVMNELGFKIGHTQYYRREVCARRAGVHADTVNHLWRNSAETDYERSEFGVKLRGLFLTADGMAKLGHPFKNYSNQDVDLSTPS